MSLLHQSDPWPYVESGSAAPIPESLWKLAEKDDLVRAFVHLMRVHGVQFGEKIALEMIAKLVERNAIMTQHLTEVISQTPLPAIKLP